MGNNNTANGLNTLRPSATVKTYDVTTQMVEEWLQRMVNVMGSAQTVKTQKQVPQINLTVFTLKASKKFYPFVVCLGTDALLGHGSNTGNDCEMAIFNPAESDGSGRLLPHVWAALSPFVYGKKDKDMFHSPAGRSALQLTTEAGKYLASTCSPRVERRGNNQMVLFLLDPLRVLHAMVKENANEGTSYQVEIENVEQSEGANYVYRFNKVPNSSKKRKKSDIQSDVERAMYTAMRRGRN